MDPHRRDQTRVGMFSGSTFGFFGLGAKSVLDG